MSIVIYPLAFSGCGYNNAGRTFFPGQSVVWTFHDASFDTSKPVELNLIRTGYNNDLYGPAAWPGSNQVEVQIPETAPTGQYTIEQIGANKGNGKLKSKTCPVWIEPAPTLASAVSADPIDTAGVQLPLVALLVGGISVATLVRLRLRRGTAS